MSDRREEKQEAGTVDYLRDDPTIMVNEYLSQALGHDKK
jgi:hypothetical protein